ncbi:MAG TPA: twin-arginine translocase subunit TatC [Polyangiaceae bacterium]|nr:twin-arginine translocase subunit TatC [Polyangiaceae bacterium]
MSKLPEQDKKPNVPEEQTQDQGMTLWEHLDELRGRLVKMIVAFVVGGGLAWTKRKELLQIITIPFVEAWNKGHHVGKAALHFPAPASLFLAYVRIAAIAGFVFALPFILWQIWAFVAPGLYSKEKRYAAPFVICSCLLFAGGGYFAWKIAFPLAFNFLLNMGEQVGELEVRPTVMISDYLDFITRMGLAFGGAAELPILAFFLSVAGLITHKHLIKFFRYFLVVDFIVAAVVTPPDVMSQLLLAIPLAMLYILSIGVAWIFGKKKEPPDDGSPPAT